MQAMPQAQVSLSSFWPNEELYCLLHIQQSPHCFDLNPPKKTTNLHIKHTT